MGDIPQQERQVTTYSNWLPRTAVLFTGVLIRALSLDFQGMWRDEVDQWRFALSPLRDQLNRFFESGWNGPLFSPLLRIWITGAGDSTYAMRYFSLLCGVLCIALIYILCARMFSAKTAIWSAAICAISPYMVWYSQEVKMYTWVPMLVLIGLYGVERACKQPDWKWWGITFFATCLAFYSHILAVLMIPVQLVWYWLTPDRHKKAWVGGGIVLFLLTGPYIPLLIWQLPLFFTGRDTGFPALTFNQMVKTIISGWSTGIYTEVLAGRYILLAITTVTASCAVFGLAGLVGKQKHQHIKLVIWLLLPFLSLYLISLRRPMFTDRYLIWTAPAFYSLIAVGLTYIGKVRTALLWCVSFLVVLSTVPGLYTQATYAIKPQYKNAVAYIMDNSQVDDLLLFQIPYNARVFEFYTQNQVFNQADAPFTNWKSEDGSYQVGETYVHEEMVRISNKYNRIWLVYSEVQLWDERELVKQWLDGNWTLFDTQTYQGVKLYAYQRQ